MATVTRTYVENASSSYKSTWTISTTKADVIVNSSSFTLSLPTCTAKYVYSGKNNAYVGIDGTLTFESEYPFSIRSDWSYVYYNSLASGTTVTLPTVNVIINTINTSSIWTSSNKTTRSIPVYCKYNLITLQSGYIDSGGTGSKENSITTRTDPVFMICNAILDAPPLVTLGTPTYSEPQWAGLGTYSVPITQASAQYGGDISSITLSVGSDSVTQTYSSATISDQTVSLIPSIAGTYTPTITVTDSRGQVTITNLPQITVSSYTAPSMNFDLARCDSSGVPQAEGEYGVVTANISYVDAIAELTQPTVSVKDEGDNTIVSSATWYTTWNATNGVSNAVNWTNYNPTSPVTLYGVISATGSVFSPSESYTVSITPTDNMGGVASTITQTLATGFFTIDFQAGGKEIAFGAPANDNLTSYPDGLFRCDMDAQFNGDVKFNGDVAAVGDSTFTTGDTEIENPYFSLDTTAQTGTTDGDLYAAIVTLGWDSDVIV